MPFIAGTCGQGKDRDTSHMLDFKCPVCNIQGDLLSEIKYDNCIY